MSFEQVMNKMHTLKERAEHLAIILEDGLVLDITSTDLQDLLIEVEGELAQMHFTLDDAQGQVYMMQETIDGQH